MERPEFYTDDMLYFLNDLRESGDTNMFGAAPYLRSKFPELTKEQAKAVLIYWMKTFKEEVR